MMIGTNGKGRMLRCPLDTGCSESILLKKLNDERMRSKLSEKDKVQYTTYGGKVVSTEIATLPLRLVEFGE